MGSVQLEAFAWVTRAFGDSTDSRLRISEEVSGGETVRELFCRLAATYPAFGELVFDPAAQRLTGQVAVILSGRQLELAGGLDARLKDEDTFLLLPALAGG